MIDKELFAKQSKAFDKLETSLKATSDAWAEFANQTAELGRQASNAGLADNIVWCALLSPGRARQLIEIELLRLNKTWENDVNYFPHAFPGVNEARKSARQWSVQGWPELATGDPKKFMSMRKRLDEQRKRLFNIIYKE